MFTDICNEHSEYIAELEASHAEEIADIEASHAEEIADYAQRLANLEAVRLEDRTYIDRRFVNQGSAIQGLCTRLLKLQKSARNTQQVTPVVVNNRRTGTYFTPREFVKPGSTKLPTEGEFHRMRRELCKLRRLTQQSN